MPVTMLQVSTINTAVTRPAIASTKSAKSIFATLLSINRPTYISAGAVAYTGTRYESGERNRISRNRTPTVIAVRPVLPPAAVPAADSMYTAAGAAPTRPENTLLRESVVSALPPSIICPSLSSKFA